MSLWGSENAPNIPFKTHAPVAKPYNLVKSQNPQNRRKRTPESSPNFYTCTPTNNFYTCVPTHTTSACVPTHNFYMCAYIQLLHMFAYTHNFYTCAYTQLLYMCAYTHSFHTCVPTYTINKCNKKLKPMWINKAHSDQIMQSVALPSRTRYMYKCMKWSINNKKYF